MINRILLIMIIAVAVFSCAEEETVADMRQEVNSHDEHKEKVDTPYIEHDTYRGQDYPPYRVLSLDSFTCAENPQPGIEVFQPIDSVPPLGKFFCCYGGYHGCKEGHYFQGTNEINMDGSLNPDALWKKASMEFSTYEFGYRFREGMTYLLSDLAKRNWATNQKIPLVHFDNFSMNTWNDDIFLNQYRPVEGGDSWIVFTHIDTISGRLEGRMTLHVYNSEPNPKYDGNPDTFRIEQIEFWAEVNPYTY